MVRRISASQLKSKMRQAQRKQQDAIRKFNNDVKKYNNNVKKVVNNYNQEVRNHNARVRSNQQKLKRSLNSLQGPSSRSIITYQTGLNLYTTANTLEQSYENLEANNTLGKENYSSSNLLNLSAKEANNSQDLYSTLVDQDTTPPVNEQLLQTSEVEQILNQHDMELGRRWGGALFSLNPSNPDAARHFCTSAREIYDRLIERYASNSDVLQVFPDCSLHNGKPNRRTKLQYILMQRNLGSNVFTDFVDNDVSDILNLFRSLNDGTHGHAGKFTIQQLLKLKIRIEDSLIFITSIISKQLNS